MGAKPYQRISEADYLSREVLSPRKHELVGGQMHQMPDMRNAHNMIAGNVLGAVHARVKGCGGRAFNSNTKIRIRLPNEVRFYYPDASVVCQQNSPAEYFHDYPVAIFEVLSQATRRIDCGEKKDAYLTIPSLAVYALVEQESAMVVVHRRTEQGFVPEVYEGRSAVIPLPEIETELPLAEIYDGVEFTPELGEPSDTP